MDLKNKAGIMAIIDEYGPDVAELGRYLGWLESKKGENLMDVYDPSKGEGGTIKFPVYDGTLMNFVRTADKTRFINRNYQYSYSKYRIRTVADELSFIEKAEIKDMKVMGDILSKYIIKGRTKGSMWSEGVSNGVYYALVSKMKELVEFWTKPF